MENKIAEKDHLPEKQLSVEDYILTTLLYTPHYYVKHERVCEIKVYAPNEDQPSMKIFRMISRCIDIPSTPAGCQEISFQDEVNVLSEGEIDIMTRWQINFSIFVNKETFEFISIHEKPQKVSSVSESLLVFKKLSQQKDATLYLGSYRFESDGNGWVPSNLNDSSSTKISECKMVLGK